MTTVIDLDEAAAAIERRRPSWTSAGFEVGPLTWRDQGVDWPYPLVQKADAVDPDSVGVACRRAHVEVEIVIFGGHHYATHGSWADVLAVDSATGATHVDAPDLADLAAFEELLDDTFERWSSGSNA
jgi:hypothetical protein